MNRPTSSRCRCLLLLVTAFPSAIRAQVATDGSFNKPSTVLPGPAFVIPHDLGKKVGGNLFHSFSEFSLNQTQSATFTGPADVQNILSRVTGGNISTIDGMLKSEIAGANFFLLNPNGVMFGPNASVDVSGSFAVSTGDRITLGDGAHFKARASDPSDALLTSAAPAAFGFLGEKAGPITFDGSKLPGPPDPQTGQPAIGGKWTLAGGEIRMKNGAALNTTGVVIRAGRLVMNNSTIAVDAQRRSDHADVRATQAISLKNGSSIQTSVGSSAGSGSGGIRISAPDIELRDRGSAISSATTGTAKSGAVQIDTPGELVIRDGAIVETKTDGLGAGGDIAIHAGKVMLIGQQPFDTGINADSRGLIPNAGNAGNIRLNVDGSLTIRAGDQPEFSTNGDVFGAVKISSDTVGSGRAGNIEITARSLRVAGRGISTFAGISAESQGAIGGGAGGNLRLNIRREVELTGGGQITAQTIGPATGGSIDITAANLLIAGEGTPQDTSINARTTGQTTGGRGGDVRLGIAGDLTIRSGGTIAAGSTGSGAGGSIQIEARHIFMSDASSSITTTTELPANGGPGGNIRIRADSIDGRAGAEISASTIGSGIGGVLDIAASRITLDSAKISADTKAPPTFQAGLTTSDLRVTFDLFQPGPGKPVSIELDNLLGVRLDLSPGRVVEGRQSFTVPLPSVNGTPFNTVWFIIFGYPEGTPFDRANPLRLDAWSLTIATPDGRVIPPSGVIPLTSDGTPSIIISDTTLTVRALDTPTSLPGPNDSANSFSIILVGDSLTKAVPLIPGRGGDILISADHLSILGGAQVSARTFDSARGGSVNVKAGELLVTSGGAITASTLLSGRGGNISLDAGELVISSGGKISAATAGTGKGGTIDVTAKTIVISKGGGSDAALISAESTNTGMGGRGGSISIDAGSLRIDGAPDFSTGISALSRGAGESGSVRLQLGTLALDSSAFIGSSNEGVGKAGSVVVRTDGDIFMRGGSLISTSARNADAGVIDIASGTRIDLREGAAITASAGLNGGSITVAAPDFIHLIDSSITATAGTTLAAEGGAGGNISIDPEFILLDHSVISANAAIGRGGNIFLQALNFLSSETSITATGTTAGTVEIVAPELDLSAALVILRSGLVDPSTQLREQCARRLGLDFSSFLVIGRGGVSLAPDEPLASFDNTRKRQPAR